MILSTKKNLIEEISSDYGAEVRKDQFLKHHTSMGVGGRVEYMILPSSIDAIENILQEFHQKDIPIRVLGAGTNIIADDGGLDEVILSTELLKKPVKIEGQKVTAIAGTMLSRLIRQLAESGLGGLEFAEGIPGSLGGAILMNAGSYGHTLSEFVKEVTFFEESGVKHVKKLKVEDFGYRSSPFLPSMFIAEASLEFAPKERNQILSRIEEVRKMRSDTQPLRVKSSGCIFKNPEGEHAGRIIESIGLKGWKQGDAMVSSVHANYIVNLGGARSEDIYWLIERIKEKVLQKLGILLEKEVVFWKRSL